MKIDPEIEISHALSVVNGNQAELGRQLGVKRAAVNGWKSKNIKFLPPLYAHRFVVLHGTGKAA